MNLAYICGPAGGVVDVHPAQLSDHRIGRPPGRVRALLGGPVLVTSSVGLPLGHAPQLPVTNTKRCQTINDARVLTSASGREKSIHQWEELRMFDPGDCSGD